YASAPSRGPRDVLVAERADLAPHDVDRKEIAAPIALDGLATVRAVLAPKERLRLRALLHPVVRLFLALRAAPARKVDLRGHRLLRFLGVPTRLTTRRRSFSRSRVAMRAFASMSSTAAAPMAAVLTFCMMRSIGRPEMSAPMPPRPLTGA